MKPLNREDREAMERYGVPPEDVEGMRRYQAYAEEHDIASGRVLTCATCRGVGGHLPRCPHWIPPKVFKTMKCKTCNRPNNRHHRECPVGHNGTSIMNMLSRDPRQ